MGSCWGQLWLELWEPAWKSFGLSLYPASPETAWRLKIQKRFPRRAGFFMDLRLNNVLPQVIHPGCLGCSGCRWKECRASVCHQKCRLACYPYQACSCFWWKKIICFFFKFQKKIEGKSNILASVSQRVLPGLPSPPCLPLLQTKFQICKKVHLSIFFGRWKHCLGLQKEAVGQPGY